MKFGIIAERKNPPDKRVVFSPEALFSLKESYSDLEIVVESSEIRIYKDEEYLNKGIEIVTDLSDCDVLFGVKEVPISYLIPDKKYFFFSHTIKKQPHNQKLLSAIIQKNITLIDHETIVDAENKRLIGFGRYAGIVGAYNCFRGFGIKYELFNLPKANTLSSKDDLVLRLRRQILPNLKIVLTGKGKVGNGAKEILDAMKIKEVSKDDFLNKIYTQPVYTQIDVLDYNKRKDDTQKSVTDFYNNPQEYVSDFERFTKVADIYIAGHFHNNLAPNILTNEMLKATDCKLKVVADISCDVDGPIACTLRATTIEEPFLGYLASEHKEVHHLHPGSILVMSVDNLPCELPKDASDGFGEMFKKMVIPAFFNNDKDQILERAKITENGKLKPRFEYLSDYANEIVNV